MGTWSVETSLILIYSQLDHKYTYAQPESRLDAWLSLTNSFNRSAASIRMLLYRFLQTSATAGM